MTTASACSDPFKPLAAAVFCGALSLLAGCASSPVDAQWSDPQLTGGNPLRGARVLVVCEAQDLVVRRICQDQVGAQVIAAGAMPVAAPDVATNVSGGSSAQYLAAAKAADAKAVFVTAVAPDSSVAKPGFTIGFGMGGFGGGGFGGVGVSAPVGDTKVATVYAANGSLTDAASGRLMWTARATASASQDINSQIAELAKAVVAGAGKAGLF